MKNKRFGLMLILAFAALATSCGTSGYYASTSYEDGIYYRPTKEERAKMIAEQQALREQAEQRQYDQYLAKDEDGNLYVVTELLDGETYESRLHKFDSPWYTNPYWYDTWNYGWYNSWYGYRPYYAYGYPYYGYYGYYGYYNPWYYSWGYYDPWYWGAGAYGSWYAWNYWDRARWYDRYYGHGYGPGPGPGPDRENGSRIVHTPRTSSGMYRTTGTSGSSRGMYSTKRSGSGGSVSTRTSTGTVRNSGSSRPSRTGASSSSSSGGYSRSSGSYSSGSSGGGYSGGGSSSSGSSGGGHTSSGGSHSGGGRR